MTNYEIKRGKGDSTVETQEDLYAKKDPDKGYPTDGRWNSTEKTSSWHQSSSDQEPLDATTPDERDSQ